MNLLGLINSRCVPGSFIVTKLLKIQVPLSNLVVAALFSMMTSLMLKYFMKWKHLRGEHLYFGWVILGHTFLMCQCLCIRHGAMKYALLMTGSQPLGRQVEDPKEARTIKNFLKSPLKYFSPLLISYPCP